MGGDAERTAVDLGQAEGCVVGSDDDVGVAGEAEAAAETETIDGGDDGNGAVIDRGEGFPASAVDLHERFVGGVGGEFLDVDAGLETLALGAQDDRSNLGVTAGCVQRIGERKPARDGQRIHGRVVDGDDRDVFAHFRRDHGGSILRRMLPPSGSLWHATAPAERARPALATDIVVDVAIVGAGFTGLWTAYSLKTIDPTLRVAVIEREVA